MPQSGPHLRVAALNAAPVIGDLAANIQSAAEWCDRAAALDAQLLVLPEAWTTGYDLEMFGTHDLPDVEDQAWLAPLQAAVDNTDVVVLLNSALAWPSGDRTLTTVAVTPHARARAAYDKQFLYPPETEILTPGRRGATMHLAGVPVALSICYDMNAPEHAAAAAQDGALVYVNSGAYLPGSEQVRDLRHAARALDHGMYVVFSGLLGDFAGGSGIYDPSGQPLSYLGSEEGLVLADILPALAEDARSRLPKRIQSLGDRDEPIVVPVASTPWSPGESQPATRP